MLNTIGLSDSKQNVGNWLKKRAEQWEITLKDWAKTEELMVAFDNYNRNIPGRHLTMSKKGEMLVGTMRCFIKIANADHSLNKKVPQKDIKQLTVDDVCLSFQ